MTQRSSILSPRNDIHLRSSLEAISNIPSIHCLIRPIWRTCDFNPPTGVIRNVERPQRSTGDLEAKLFGVASTGSA